MGNELVIPLYPILFFKAGIYDSLPLFFQKAAKRRIFIMYQKLYINRFIAAFRKVADQRAPRDPSVSRETFQAQKRARMIRLSNLRSQWAERMKAQARAQMNERVETFLAR